MTTDTYTLYGPPPSNMPQAWMHSRQIEVPDGKSSTLDMPEWLVERRMIHAVGTYIVVEESGGSAFTFEIREITAPRFEVVR